MLQNKKLKAVGSTIIVEIKAEEESSGLIVTNINVDARDTVIGTVIDMGKFAFVNDAGECNPRCKEGDLIMFRKNCGTTWQDPESHQWYRVMYDEDVIAVFIEK